MAGTSASGFPICTGAGAGFSRWRFVGTTWVEKSGVLSGACIYAIHFKNGDQDFLIVPRNPEDLQEIRPFNEDFLQLREEHYKDVRIVDGLGEEESAWLWFKYVEFMDPTEDPKEFTLPLVKRDHVVDITPLPGKPSPLPAFKLFLESLSAAAGNSG